MAAPLRVFVDGIGRWPGPGAAPTQKPAPALLGANERRRAGDAVLVAVEVAAQALADARFCAAGCETGGDGAVATVFASAHGDLSTTDALCRTLAGDPLLLSPTRFHHSVHNAPSGYWAIARTSHAASTALAAGPYTFAAGLLEAAAQCLADGAPVLFVAGDTPAVGLLADVNASRSLLGLALLLRPDRGRCELALRVAEATAPLPAGNPIAAGLPLVDALAAGTAAQALLPLGPGLALAAAASSRRRPAAPAAA